MKAIRTTFSYKRSFFQNVEKVCKTREEIPNNFATRMFLIRSFRISIHKPIDFAGQKSDSFFWRSIVSHFWVPELIITWSLRFLSTKILHLAVKELTHAAKVEETPATENGHILLPTNGWNTLLGVQVLSVLKQNDSQAFHISYRH